MIDDGTDIDFDFFDETPTRETTRSRIRRPGRGPRPPRRGPRQPAGFTPMLRLAGLIAFAIAIVALLTVWVNSCREDNTRDTYRSFMRELDAVASDSAGVGHDLAAALTTPGISTAELQKTLAGLAARQDQDLANARELDPPGRLRAQHAEAVEALQLRATGLAQLRDAFRQVSGKNAAEAGKTLAAPMRVLLASDVVWDDEFMANAAAVMEQRDIRGVEVPDSNFLMNYDLATEPLLSQIWQRLVGAGGGGEPAPGKHGNGIVSVTALPSGKALEEGTDNFVMATPDLAFRVVVENSGENQEVGVEVVLTIDQSPQPIEKRGKIQIINPGERKSITFRNLGQIVQFSQKTTLKVDVKPVPGETNISNNTASYSVTFTLVP
ncbi:MAG TPA: hypothetical protein VGQ15_01855 [Gaiellaceae bacterium]|nr:hypothetical protein [Gaiellaceae bacterium]